MSPRAPTHVRGGKQRKARLKAAGSAILETFHSSHSNKRYPSGAEEKELLRRVQEVPGCDLFDLYRLRQWFYRKRKQLEEQLELAGQVNMSYPSLTTEAIQHLKVLSHGNQQPSDDIMSTWALLLKANIWDIKAWILDGLLHHSEEPPEPFQMPTPHNSASPEPLTPMAESPLVQQKEIYVLPKLMDADINKILLDAVLDAAITKEVSGSDGMKYPCNILEFGNMFAPYEEKMENIISLLT